MVLQILPHDLTICKLHSQSDMDLTKDFYFIGKTDEEFSLVCQTSDAPQHTIRREDGWRGLRVQGQLDFSLTGILARLAGLLADAGISIFAVSTFNTDYLLIKKTQFEAALTVLAAAGYELRRD